MPLVRRRDGKDRDLSGRDHQALRGAEASRRVETLIAILDRCPAPAQLTFITHLPSHPHRLGRLFVPGCGAAIYQSALNHDPYAPFEQSDGHGDPGLTNEFVPQLAALAEDGRMGRDQRRLVLDLTRCSSIPRLVLSLEHAGSADMAPSRRSRTRSGLLNAAGASPSRPCSSSRSGRPRSAHLGPHQLQFGQVRVERSSISNVPIVRGAGSAPSVNRSNRGFLANGAPFAPCTLPEAATAAICSDGFQIFDQIVLLLFGQVQIEMVAVVVDDFFERGEPSIVIEPALVDLFHIPQGPQWCRHVAPIR